MFRKSSFFLVYSLSPTLSLFLSRSQTKPKKLRVGFRLPIADSAGYKWTIILFLCASLSAVAWRPQPLVFHGVIVGVFCLYVCVCACAHACVCLLSPQMCSSGEWGGGRGVIWSQANLNEKLIRSPLDVIWLAGSDGWGAGSRLSCNSRLSVLGAGRGAINSCFTGCTSPEQGSLENQSVNMECFKVRGVTKREFLDLLLPQYGLELVHPLTFNLCNQQGIQQHMQCSLCKPWRCC